MSIVEISISGWHGLCFYDYSFSATAASLEEVIIFSGKGNPFIIVQDGIYLYYSNLEEGYIARIKKGVAEPMPEMILEGLSKSAGLLIKDNILYFAHDSDKISKINLTEASLAITDIASGLAFPTNLALSGNTLFVAEFNGHKISKIEGVVASKKSTN